MSPRSKDFKAECQGKVPFSSRFSAESSCSKYRLTKDGPELHVYHCSFGNHWHIGHVQTERLSKSVKRYERPRQRRWEYV